MRKFITLSMCLLAALTVFAQAQKVTGSVVDAMTGEAVLIGLHRGLTVVAVDDDGSDVDAVGAQVINQFQRCVVVGDAEVRAHTLVLDVIGVDADQEVCLVGQLFEEPDLDIRVEARKDARGVEIANEFAAEFQEEPPLAGVHSLENLCGLGGEILFVVKRKHIME